MCSEHLQYIFNKLIHDVHYGQNILSSLCVHHFQTSIKSFSVHVHNFHHKHTSFSSLSKIMFVIVIIFIVLYEILIISMICQNISFIKFIIFIHNLSMVWWSSSSTTTVILLLCLNQSNKYRTIRSCSKQTLQLTTLTLVSRYTKRARQAEWGEQKSTSVHLGQMAVKTHLVKKPSPGFTRKPESKLGAWAPYWKTWTEFLASLVSGYVPGIALAP